MLHLDLFNEKKYQIVKFFLRICHKLKPQLYDNEKWYKTTKQLELNMHNDIVRWDNKLKVVKTGRKLI